MKELTRILLIAPSTKIVGGQSIQAVRLLENLTKADEIAISFQPIDPELPAPFNAVQRIKYVRTVVTEAVYVAALVKKIRQSDIVHIFTAGYFSFFLVSAPALAIARLFGKKSILNYHDGRAEDSLKRFPAALRLMRWADRVVCPSMFLVRVLRALASRPT